MRECGGGSYDILQGSNAEKIVSKLRDPTILKQLGLNFADLTAIPCPHSPDETPARSMEL